MQNFDFGDAVFIKPISDFVFQQFKFCHRYKLLIYRYLYWSTLSK